MTAASLDITVKCGIDFGPLVIACKDSDGNPVDLSGWSAWSQVRKQPGSEIVTELDPQISDAAGGEITLSIAHAVTARLAPGIYRWDLVLQDSDGARVGPIIQGGCTVLGVITEPA